VSAPLDTVFTAETPEGIALELRPAGLVARGYAFVIDAAIRLAVLIAAAGALAAMSRFGAGIYLILFFLLEWFYPVLFELLPGAATPGKRATGLRVVMDSGLPVTPAASLVRNLLRAADFLPVLYGFGLAAMLANRDFKRLGDLAAGTVVVYREEKLAHAATIPAAPPVPPPFSLSLEEQRALLEFAERSQSLTTERLQELATLPEPLVGSLDPAKSAERLIGMANYVAGRS
jgi:uncharacterized RDD family membrane protein YckC